MMRLITAAVLHGRRGEIVANVCHFEVSRSQARLDGQERCRTDQDRFDRGRSDGYAHSMGLAVLRSRFRELRITNPPANSTDVFRVSRFIALFFVVVFVFFTRQENNKPEYLKNLVLKFKELDDYLGSHQFFAGDCVIMILHFVFFLQY